MQIPFIIEFTINTNAPGRRALEPIHRYAQNRSKTFDNSPTVIRPEEAKLFSTIGAAQSWLFLNGFARRVKVNGEWIFRPKANPLFTGYAIKKANSILPEKFSEKVVKEKPVDTDHKGMKIELVGADMSRAVVDIKKKTPWVFRQGRYYGYSHCVRGGIPVYYQPKETTEEVMDRANKEGIQVL